jgi:hypothetical protein
VHAKKAGETPSPAAVVLIYAELAERLGIGREAVRLQAKRQRWEVLPTAAVSPASGPSRGAACGSHRPPTLAFPPPVLRAAIPLPRPFKSRCASLLPRHLLEHTGMLLRTSVGLSSSVTALMTPPKPASQGKA